MRRPRSRAHIAVGCNARLCLHVRPRAQRRSLETAPVANESGDPALALARAERQLRELRAELAMRDMLSGRTHVGYDDLTEGEVAELQALVTRYLSGRKP